jgi:hypothetical protein
MVDKKNLKLEDYRVERNTLSRVVKDDSKEKIELEIGDSKQEEFFPQAKIMKWDNEVNFSIRYDNKSRNFKEENGKIICEGNENVQIYELDGFEDGGLEFEIVLKEKPETNIFNFTLETKGLNFFYQRELTEKEKEQGAKRPENVVGSYAVYHKTKKNNNTKGKFYKTGKFFHIYRPKTIDDSGKEIYCDLNIDEDKKILSVSVPEEFLNNAVYPVRVDPTFGYTSVGGSYAEAATTRNNFGNQQFIWTRFGTAYNISENLNITKLTAYLDTMDDYDEQSASFKGALNNLDSEGTNKHGEIEISPEISIDDTDVPDWIDIPFSQNVSVQDDDKVVLNILGDPTDLPMPDNILVWKGFIMYFDNQDEGTVERGIYNSSLGTDRYTTPDDPWESNNSTHWNWATINNEQRQHSLYATYTESATGTNTQINIGDAWKEVSAMKINIGDTWKEVAGAQINIGDSWKTIF